MEPEKPKKIAVLNDPADAEILRGMLEAQGLTVVLSKEAASSVYGVTMGGFGEIEVFVPGKQAAEAEKIVTEFFGGNAVQGNED